ncbi:MAG: hypothetical protein LBH98_08765 [Chitinispirillales bacterium]|jgi:hypothetical protein|nr:hypothetical protein [Chitinispirillales bacterium]
MEFTREQIDHLLNLSKMVEINGVLENSVTFNQEAPFKQQYKLKSPIDDDYIFFYDINQSAKNHLKLTLHLIDNNTKAGLLRVDFNGQHQNPEKIKDGLPKDFHLFAGKFFDYNEHHIHYYVEGYKPLAWAKPLENNFPVSSIASHADVISAFTAFNAMITLETRFTINPILI